MISFLLSSPDSAVHGGKHEPKAGN